MSTVSPQAYDAEPFAGGGLDALLVAAGCEAPEAILLADDSGSMSAATLLRRVRQLSRQFEVCGLVPGERILVVAGAQSESMVALAAALHARLEPVVAPCGQGPVELAAYVAASRAVALVGPSEYGGLALGEAYLSAAALAETIRILVTQGPALVDGAVDGSFAALDAMEHPSETADPGGESPMIGTFQGPATAPILLLHRQAALLADALSLVEQASINPSKRILMTLPPATLAGLVAGPFAALMGAAGLVFHGPFSARRFLAACESEPGSHLVVPAMLGRLLDNAGMIGNFASLVLVSRFAGSAAFVLPEHLASERPIVDLYAYGEDTVLAQRRTEGSARAPNRVTDKSLAGGLGAKLNRANAEARAHGERP